jgi:hypothetical protein
VECQRSCRRVSTGARRSEEESTCYFASTSAFSVCSCLAPHLTERTQKTGKSSYICHHAHPHPNIRTATARSEDGYTAQPSTNNGADTVIAANASVQSVHHHQTTPSSNHRHRRAPEWDHPDHPASTSTAAARQEARTRARRQRRRKPRKRRRGRRRRQRERQRDHDTGTGQAAGRCHCKSWDACRTSETGQEAAHGTALLSLSASRSLSALGPDAFAP